MTELKFFQPAEFACPCGCGRGHAEMHPDFLARLDRARLLADTPFRITSGFRCPKHNQAVGGAPGSAHILGRAVDIATPDDATRYAVLTSLWQAGFFRLGVYPHHVHADDAREDALIWYGK